MTFNFEKVIVLLGEKVTMLQNTLQTTESFDFENTYLTTKSSSDKNKVDKCGIVPRQSLQNEPGVKKQNGSRLLIVSHVEFVFCY